MGNKITQIKPKIFYQNFYSKKDLSIFKKNINIWNVVDLYRSQLREIFEINNPHLIFSSNFKRRQEIFLRNRLKNDSGVGGNWIYYPWSGFLVHTVSEDEYFKIRTNRNKLLITDLEQKKLRDSKVGIVGMSIGGNMAVGLSYSGISKTMKLADHDVLATSNLNRVRAGIQDVGLSKIEVVSRKIYEIDPYANLISYNKGLNYKNMNSFFEENEKLQLIIDACDDFKMKISIRIEAKKRQMPVIMLTSLGDNLLVDIERYDLDKNIKIFNGRIGKIFDEILSKQITEEDKKKFAIMLVDPKNVPERALKTVQDIGKQFVGRPQINSTVTIGSGLVLFLAKEILLNNSTFSGRKKISFSDFVTK